MSYADGEEWKQPAKPEEEEKEYHLTRSAMMIERMIGEDPEQRPAAAAAQWNKTTAVSVVYPPEDRPVPNKAVQNAMAASAIIRGGDLFDYYDQQVIHVRNVAPGDVYGNYQWCINIRSHTMMHQSRDRNQLPYQFLDTVMRVALYRWNQLANKAIREKQRLVRRIHGKHSTELYPMDVVIDVNSFWNPRKSGPLEQQQFRDDIAAIIHAIGYWQRPIAGSKGSDGGGALNVFLNIELIPRDLENRPINQSEWLRRVTDNTLWRMRETWTAGILSFPATDPQTYKYHIDLQNQRNGPGVVIGARPESPVRRLSPLSHRQRAGARINPEVVDLTQENPEPIVMYPEASLSVPMEEANAGIRRSEMESKRQADAVYSCLVCANTDKSVLNQCAECSCVLCNGSLCTELNPQVMWHQCEPDPMQQGPQETCKNMLCGQCGVMQCRIHNRKPRDLSEAVVPPVSINEAIQVDLHMAQSIPEYLPSSSSDMDESVPLPASASVAMEAVPVLPPLPSAKVIAASKDAVKNFTQMLNLPKQDVIVRSFNTWDLGNGRTVEYAGKTTLVPGDIVMPVNRMRDESEDKGYEHRAILGPQNDREVRDPAITKRWLVHGAVVKWYLYYEPNQTFVLDPLENKPQERKKYDSWDIAPDDVDTRLDRLPRPTHNMELVTFNPKWNKDMHLYWMATSEIRPNDTLRAFIGKGPVRVLPLPGNVRKMGRVPDNGKVTDAQLRMEAFAQGHDPEPERGFSPRNTAPTSKRQSRSSKRTKKHGSDISNTATSQHASGGDVSLEMDDHMEAKTDQREESDDDSDAPLPVILEPSCSEEEEEEEKTDNVDVQFTDDA